MTRFFCLMHTLFLSFRTDNSSYFIFRRICDRVYSMRQPKYIRVLLNRIKKCSLLQQKVLYYLAIVEYYSNVDNNMAEKYVQTALESVKKIPIELALKVYLSACSVYNFIGDIEKVGEYLVSAKEIAGIAENVELQYAFVQFFTLVLQGRSGNPQLLVEGIQSVFPIIEEYGTEKEKATLYHSYGLSLSFLGRNDEALEYLLRAVQKSAEIESYVAQVRSMLAILEIYSRMSLNEDVISYSAKTLSIIENIDLIHLEGRCRLYRGRNLFFLGKLNDSVEELKKAYSLFVELNDKQGENYCLINLSTSYRELGLLEESVRHLMPLLQLQEPIWWEVRYHAYMSLGMIFLQSGDPEKSVELLYVALTQLPETKSNLDFFTAPLYGNLGYAYLLLKNYSEAEKYLFKVLHIFIESDFQRQVSAALENISALYIIRGDYEKAEETIQQALAISKKVSYIHGIINALNILAEIYLKTNRYSEGIIILNELLCHTEGSTYLRSEMNAHRLFAEIYEKSGDELKAFRHLKKYNELHEKFWNFEVASNIYDVFRIIEEQKHQNKEITLAKAKEHLEIEIRQRERELRSLAIQLTQRNQALLTLKNEVDKIRSENIRKKKKSLPKELLNSVRDLENNWESFRLQFDAVHQGFYDRLLRIFPELTEAEARICCLMKVELSTKQIADVLFISPRTVETHRLRIRKKVMHGRIDDLRKYIVSME